MAKRSDSLPPPKKPAHVKLVVEAETRDKLSEVAWHHGYSMSSLMRLVAEEVTKDPGGMLKNIPKNPMKTP